MEKLLLVGVAAVAATATIVKLKKENKELKRQLQYEQINSDSLFKVNQNLFNEYISLWD